MYMHITSTIQRLAWQEVIMPVMQHYIYHCAIMYDNAFPDYIKPLPLCPLQNRLHLPLRNTNSVKCQGFVAYYSNYTVLHCYCILVWWYAHWSFYACNVITLQLIDFIGMGIFVCQKIHWERLKAWERCDNACWSFCSYSLYRWFAVILVEWEYLYARTFTERG